jgi:tubulin-specific chaperone E
MESNHFKALSDIAPLACLRKLRVLALNFNNISKTSNDASDLASLQFGPELKRLELAFNEVGDWDFVNQLTLIFPNLENLRISHNPLFDKSEFRSADDGYLLTIARIKGLKILNYSPVRCGGISISSADFTRLRPKIG